MAGAIVNVASGENVSNQQLVDCINTHGFALSLPTGGTAATMPLCNATRLRELLGLEPTPVRRWIDAHLSARIA